MKGKGKLFSAMILAALLLLTGIMPVWAAGTAGSDAGTVTVTSKPIDRSGWVKKGKSYYWKDVNGRIRKKAGVLDIGKNRYYLNKNGSRVTSAFKKIKGKYYYFQKNGRMLKPAKKGFRTISKKKYYFYTDGHVAAGRVKIGKSYYYFNSKGRLQKNVNAVKVGKTYYNVNSKGIMVKISSKKAKCEKAAQKFIKKHSRSSQSNAQKFRSCFYYLLGYMRYSPGYFRSSSDYKIIDKKEGAYELALSTFNSPNLRGNCHRFACCVAAIAFELGYKKPTVIATTGDHSFVIINGGYYDNMYGGLFGAGSRPSYSVYKKTVFK